ncbi:Gfo/Idh/MocA family oxidoreductase [uncultured Sunxiuqinia sp.]|uniref:Gfo/Idh/MocA family protein n=1 Tax=uncultured Sunxiuqinia sp. TaxID=1573825 RepID=UPI002637B971|nr:Gfo/Idh/MocA family oxidoreductase [uncultured Sunxiuqinia sp.]
MSTVKIGFLGAGGIAKAHAYSLNSLRYYYPEMPPVVFESVCSQREESRQQFARDYGFRQSQDEADFLQNDAIDTVLILGPNKVHAEHLKAVAQMPNVKRIYLEKPVCSNLQEEQELAALALAGKKVQVGFQYLQTASVREAIAFWKSGKLGRPIHFDLKYYHGDYLQKSYRDKRQTRLTPAPDGGAMADLGSHGISLLLSFLGEQLEITSALQGGDFADVPGDSDLFSSLSLVDPVTRAVGNMSASRISSGSGDLVYLEIYAEKGTLRYTSQRPESFDYFLEETQQWINQPVGSHYKPISSFPSGHVPPGWLRSMVHAHYLFLGGADEKAFVPDLQHGLAVQRLVRETATHLSSFRKQVSVHVKK